MKGLSRLLLYYFTWRSIIVGIVVFAALLLAFGLSLYLLYPQAAFALTMLAYAFALMMPYILAPIGLRSLIASQGLAQVPGLPLRAGQALLLLTLLVAVTPVLVGRIFGKSGSEWVIYTFIFVLASLYSFAMYVVLPLRGMPWYMSIGPALLMGISQALDLRLILFLNNLPALAVAILMTIAGWIALLLHLAKHRKFPPLFQTHATSYTQNSGISQGFGLFAATVHGRAAAAASLLFAYPASGALRWFNTTSFATLQPLIAVAIILFMNAMGDNENHFMSPLRTYLLFTLFSGSIASLAQGELGARARLLWLRVPGDRSAIWRNVERELWVNLLLLAFGLLVISCVAVLLDPAMPYVKHFLLLVIACNCYCLYFQLCGRLYQWPSLVQAGVMLLSLVLVVAVIIATLRIPGFSGLTLLEVGLLVFALLFRQCARSRFLRVDWLVLKHSVAKQVLVEG